MKILIPILLGIGLGAAHAADVKFSELPAASSVTADDLVPIVNDPAGTPATQKATAAQIATFVLGSDAEAAALIGLTSAADRLPYFTGSGTASLATFTSFGRSLIDDAASSNARTTLGLVIGTDVSAWDADLDAIAALSPSNDDIIQRKAGSWVNRTIAQYKSDLALVKADVGLGSVENTALSTWAGSTNLTTLGTITTGTWTGTAIAVANGGTGSATAANARTALGLAIGTNVQAWDTDLDTWATKTPPSGTVVGLSDSPTWTGNHTWSLAEVANYLIETDQTTNEKWWRWDLQGKSLCLQTRTDADGAGVNALCSNRGTGTAVNTTTVAGDFSTASGGAVTATAGSIIGIRISVSGNTGSPPQVGLSAPGANQLQFNTATTARGMFDANGAFIYNAAILSAGTKFTASGCSNGTTVGGATAGKFTSGTTGACTVTITLPTATTDWNCLATNATTVANLMVQTDTTAHTTSCTISGTTVTGDIIRFVAMGY